MMKNKIYLPLYLYILVFLISFYLFYKSYIDEFSITMILITIIIVEIIAMNFNTIKKIMKFFFKNIIS